MLFVRCIGFIVFCCFGNRWCKMIFLYRFIRVIVFCFFYYFIRGCFYFFFLIILSVKRLNYCVVFFLFDVDLRVDIDGLRIVCFFKKKKGNKL